VITMTEQATDTVDTPAPDPTPQVRTADLSWLPQATDLPRESAQETVIIADGVLVGVYDAAPALAADLDLAADVRRRLAILTDVVTKRDLSKAGTRDMMAALRIAERALALAMNGETRANWREYVPDLDTMHRCEALANVDPDAFAQALAALHLGDGPLPTVEALLAVVAGDTPETEELDTPTVDDQSDLSPDEVAATVTAGLSYLAEAARILRRVTPEHMRALTPEVAADWVRQVWDDSVPVLTLRKNLIERGND
jgi:hypothetical protein